MAKRIMQLHPVPAVWAASGPINLDLSNKPYTITAALINVRLTIDTTGTPGDYVDQFDRNISRLTLQGGGKTYFDRTDMRVGYQHDRLFLGRYSPKRPAGIAASQTGATIQFSYLIHFGVCPEFVDPLSQRVRYNPFDLTGGIEPAANGNLVLTGNWGAAAASGSGYTVTAGQADVYLFGLIPEANDPPEAWRPRATPAWLMDAPTLAGTTGAFGATENVPVGSFVHSALAYLTAGSNNPRNNTVLNSIRVQDVLNSFTPWSFGGQSGANADYLAAEIVSQIMQGDPGATPAVLDAAAASLTVANSIGTYGDKGLVYLPFSTFTARAMTPYGMDLRSMGTGSVQIQFGIATITNAALQFSYRRYDLNPNHPANAGL